jgi:hypothetical protein
VTKQTDTPAGRSLGSALSYQQPPNTALQRTRSAPLRSPLSFEPFGATVIRRVSVAASVLAMLIGPACYRPSTFRGDGQLSRSSWFSGKPMYTLDLEPLAVDRPGRYTFRFQGLPETEMVLGIRVAHSSTGMVWPSDAKPIATDVRVTMVNERNERVLDGGGPLSGWTWSGSSAKPSESFVYLEGRLTGVPQKDGSSLTKRLGGRPDGGWGSYFAPRGPAMYLLTVELSQPKVSGKAMRASLVAESYRWFD